MTEHPATSDPYLKPQTSLSSKLGRTAWTMVYLLFFRPSPRPLHAWRAFLLRCFGARLGANSRISPGCRLWAPWNLQCEDVVAIASGAEIYNPWPVSIGSHATLSQHAYLCAASHDIDDPSFPMVGRPIVIGRHAWICARATVLPGVTVGDGAVLALGAIATRDLEPWSVYGGKPAKFIRQRRAQP